MMLWLLTFVTAYLCCHCSALSSKDTLDVSAMERHAHLRSPIITDCLQECGFEDQSCITSCEVCAEHFKCRTILMECDSCLEAAKGMRKHRNAWNSTLFTDSGGTPLLREDLYERLEVAQNKALEARREVRSARAEVLRAAQQADWAAAERVDEVNKLRQATSALKEARKELNQKSSQHFKNIRQLNENSEARRDDVAEAARAHEEQEAEKNHREDIGEASEEEHSKETDDPASDNKVRARMQVAARAEDRADDVARHANLQERQLERDAKKARIEVQKVIEDLHQARLAVYVSGDVVKEAKRQYLRSATNSREMDGEVEELKTKLTELAKPKLPSHGLDPDERSGATRGTHILPVVIFGAVAAHASRHQVTGLER